MFAYIWKPWSKRVGGGASPHIEARFLRTLWSQNSWTQINLPEQYGTSNLKPLHNKRIVWSLHVCLLGFHTGKRHITELLWAIFSFPFPEGKKSGYNMIWSTCVFFSSTAWGLMAYEVYNHRALISDDDAGVWVPRGHMRMPDHHQLPNNTDTWSLN
jgi:hypothetical protein